MKKYNIILSIIIYFIFASNSLAEEDWLKAVDNLSISEIENVVTSVSKTPEPLFKAPSAIYVLTKSDIEQSGATSIPEAMYGIYKIKLLYFAFKEECITDLIVYERSDAE